MDETMAWRCPTVALGRNRGGKPAADGCIVRLAGGGGGEATLAEPSGTAICTGPLLGRARPEALSFMQPGEAWPPEFEAEGVAKLARAELLLSVLGKGNGGAIGEAHAAAAATAAAPMLLLLEDRLKADCCGEEMLEAGGGDKGDGAPGAKEPPKLPVEPTAVTRGPAERPPSAGQAFPGNLPAAKLSLAAMASFMPEDPMYDSLCGSTPGGGFEGHGMAPPRT